MYIYNVTINIEESVHDQWLAWMKEIHIPEMLATGKFTQAKMCKVMVEEELGGITYSVQYTTKDKETLQSYYKEDAEGMREEGTARFPNKFVAFRTELEVMSVQETKNIPATEFLFTYGTLQEAAVQKSLFSRILEGSPDRLLAHRHTNNKVAGLYPSIVASGEPDHFVEGLVFTISGADLLRADVYEGEAYHRKKVSLVSGVNAWVYLGKITDAR